MTSIILFSLNAYQSKQTRFHCSLIASSRLLFDTWLNVPLNLMLDSINCFARPSPLIHDTKIVSREKNNKWCWMMLRILIYLFKAYKFLLVKHFIITLFIYFYSYHYFIDYYIINYFSLYIIILKMKFWESLHQKPRNDNKKKEKKKREMKWRRPGSNRRPSVC